MLIKEIIDDTHYQMDRYTMFLDWKNQYCQNDYCQMQSIDSMQSLSNYQQHFSQKLNKFVCCCCCCCCLICVEIYKTSNSQSNLKKNGARAIRLSDYRLYYKDSHQNSMVLTQNWKQINGTGQKPRNKPTHLWSINL